VKLELGNEIRHPRVRRYFFDKQKLLFNKEFNKFASLFACRIVQVLKGHFNEIRF